MYEALYKTAPGRALARVFAYPAFSKAAGALLSAPVSRPLIRRFVKKHGICLEEAECTNFESFNAFFTRRLKPGARPVDAAEDAFISPCDGLLSAYTIDEDCHFSVKGSVYTPLMLTRDPDMNAEFQNGLCLVFRLTPAHYHRYMFPADGVVARQVRIPGILHTVRPLALTYAPVFALNAREYTLSSAPRFGRLMQMEVGATIVGKITNADFEGQRVVKGQEKGYFEFGGSTIVLFLQKDALTLRPELERARETEVTVRAGERLNV